MDFQNIFSKVFMWMFIGLMITFITGYAVSLNENMLYNIFNSGWYIFIIILEIITVLFLSWRINKISFMGCIIGFVFYSLLTGLMLSLVFVIYELGSIVFVFGITAFLFGVFAVIGFITKIDLSRLRTILLMGLIGLLIAFILSLFINDPTFNLIYLLLGLLIFIGYIAYDIHIIKNKMLMINDPNKLAIFGALQLYLDFINIFIRLLRLFGKAKD